MPSHPARFRPWLAVLAGTLAAVLLVEALRPKAPVQAQAPASLPAPARADVQALPATATAEGAVVASHATVSAPAPVAKRIAKADGRTRSRHARIHRKAMDVVAAVPSPLPAAPSKDTAALPHLDSLVATHTDSCLDGIAFVSSDSLAQTALPTDSLTAPVAAQALRPNVPELAATAPRPCLQLPRNPEALKPEAPQAVLLPLSPEKSLQ